MISHQNGRLGNVDPCHLLSAVLGSYGIYDSAYITFQQHGVLGV